jgi:hypothetical protein
VAPPSAMALSSESTSERPEVCQLNIGGPPASRTRPALRQRDWWPAPLLDAVERLVTSGRCCRQLDRVGVESLRELPQLWNDAEPSGRKLLAEALFERIDILGTRKVKLHPSASAKAQGWDRAWNGARLVVMVGARGVGPPTEPAGLWCEVDGL